MKTIGMIGGTGWISTIEYYRILNSETNKRLGGLKAARILLNSFNYADIDRLNNEGDSEGVCSMVKAAAVILQAAGAECVMLCANTLHQYFDEVQSVIDIPILHIAEATAKAIQQKGLSKIALLGTRYTMELDFYKTRLRAAGIEPLVPQKEEIEFIHSSINNELLLGIFKDETKKEFLNIINRLVLNGAEGVVLGCTEIPLLISQNDMDIPVFNTLEIHARAAVDFAL